MTWEQLTPQARAERKNETTDRHKYRKLKKEYAADEWAVNYINANYDGEFMDYVEELVKAYAAVDKKDFKNFLENA